MKETKKKRPSRMRMTENDGHLAGDIEVMVKAYRREIKKHHKPRKQPDHVRD